MFKIYRSMQKELGITWLFIRNDIWATIIPGSIITLSAIYIHQRDAGVAIVEILESIVYFFFYVYTFVLINQLTGIEEDILNKPFRPLPRKLVTIKGVYIRFLISAIIFIVVSILLGVLGWAILWILTNLFLNFVGHRHWFTKNVICMSLGIFAMIGAAWEIVAPMTQSQLLWAILVSVVFGTCGVIQDFRDVSGDLKLGRKTLPIALGDLNARIFASVIILTSLLIFTLFVIIPSNKNLLSVLFSVLITIFFVVIGVRLMKFRTSAEDHKTYMILLYLFNIVLLSSIIYL